MNISYLPPCATEDSTDCFWDATQHGNHEGQSFVTYQGDTLPLTVPEGTYVLGVALSPASPTGYSVAYQEFPSFEFQIAPAYDMTLPVVIVAAGLIAAVVTLVVGFIRRSHS